MSTRPPDRRGIGCVSSLALAVSGAIFVVASVESIGLVGDGTSEISWPLAVPGLVLLGAAPIAPAAVRRRPGWVRRAMIALLAATAVSIVVGAVAGSFVLALVCWFGIQIVVASS